MELLILEQAADTLGKNIAEILEQATFGHITIGTITRNGTALFLVAEDVHQFLANPGATIKTSDLKLTYNECLDPESNYIPAPNFLIGPPVSEITIQTLCITQKEVARLKKALGPRSRLRAMIKKWPLNRVETIITMIVSIIAIISALAGLF